MFLNHNQLEERNDDDGGGVKVDISISGLDILVDGGDIEKVGMCIGKNNFRGKG